MSFNKFDFENILKFCKNQYGSKIIESEIIFDSLFILIDIGDDCNSYPYIDKDKFKIQKQSLDFYNTILNIIINITGTAEFFFKGFMHHDKYMDPDIEGYFVDQEEKVQECFTLKIENFEDLKDVIDYISQVATQEKFRILPNFHFKEIEVNNILDNVQLYIPEISRKYLLPIKLLSKNEPLNGIEEVQSKIVNPEQYIQKEYVPYSEVDLMDDEHFLEADKIEKEAKIVFEQKKKLINNQIENNKIGEEISIGNIFIIKKNDYPYVFSYNNLITPNLHEIYGDNSILHNDEYNIYYVLKLKRTTSFIGIYDFLTNSQEGFSFLLEFIKTRKLPLKIIYLQNKYVQIQYALETRINKIALINTVKKLTTNKENFKLSNNLTNKRLSYISSFYNEQYKLIEMMENPLPFVIEKAYRNYVRSDGGIEMVTSGLNLLNILIKTRLLFPLEEYMTDCLNIDKNFNILVKKEFYEKNPTDGTFSRVYGILNKTIASNGFNLECFGNFNNILSTKNINSTFNEIIEIRNRFAHPPYDVETFIKTLSHYIPDLINEYREAMLNIDLLVPKRFSNKNKTLIMSAKKLMGFEENFEIVDVIITKEEILNFEVEKLVAYNNVTKKIIPLSNFIGLIIKNKPIYSIGLFDRYEKGKAIFEF